VLLCSGGLLNQIPYNYRLSLLEELLRDFLVGTRRTLLKWAALTGQSAQIDTGYIAQHLASIVLCEPGQGFRGKGLDLADGSEVKSAAIISGVDRPRWNHNLGTPSRDVSRQERGLPPDWQSYLEAPAVFYFLFDRVVDDRNAADQSVLRARAWCVDPHSDEAWQLLTRFIEQRGPAQYNFQLHPPVGYDDSIAVNTLGNLDMADVKVLEMRMRGLAVDEELGIDWVQRPPEHLRPIHGRCRALPYGGRGARPSRLNAPADLEPDIDAIQRLVPGIDADVLRAAVEAEVRAATEAGDDEGDQP